jgi:hypothetical protein
MRTSKKKEGGRSTSSHGNEKFKPRSMEKQGGMAFGFRKTATAVLKPDRQIESLLHVSITSNHNQADISVTRT